MTRSRNWYGGPGSRAMTRSSSKTRYGSPNASDGLPTAKARMRCAVVKSGEFEGAALGTAAVAARQIACSVSRVSPVSRSDMSVISTIGLPSAYIRASAIAYGSGR